jgi:hypothetical protein
VGGGREHCAVLDGCDALTLPTGVRAVHKI